MDIEGERGSLIILVLALFTVLLVSSLTLIDVSDNFLAKRQLVEVGEVAITSAAHQLSLTRYYGGNILMDSAGADGAQFRIPLDCNKAQESFTQEISAATLRSYPISIDSWSCSADEVTATISSEIPILINLPFGIGASSTQIQATIAATSIIGGYRN
jgi:hypothetical protein